MAEEKDSMQDIITYSGAGGLKVTETREESWIRLQLKREAESLAGLFDKGDEQDPQKLAEMAEKLRKK